MLLACESTGVEPLSVVDAADVAAFNDAAAEPVDAGHDGPLADAAEADASANARADAQPDGAWDSGPDAALPPPFDARQGVQFDDGWLHAELFSANASRVQLTLYREPTGAPFLTIDLDAGADGSWTTTASTEGVEPPFFYGYRVWGPNWMPHPEWTAGTTLGYEADVDENGHRFNPNKLLLDPFAREISHDHFGPGRTDGRPYQTGEHRALDSGPTAPRGLVLPDESTDRPAAPDRAFRDDIIYEVHLRGLTAGDPSIPEDLRGTYAGAALKAGELAALGVTAVEFLPLHETQNDQNDLEEGTPGDNYWGYSTLSFFAPDRRYSADKSPGGPTREFKAMVDAFHTMGLKVYVDVVYNHTGEGGTWNDGESANLWSWRGVENSAYYQTVAGRAYQSNSGVGPNLRFTHPQVRHMVIESLRYWHVDLGVDGYRFDLASVLGNACDEQCFQYGKDGLLTQIMDELPIRPADGGPGLDLIAEPWAIGPGTYQVGNFPGAWAEWNDQYRDALRIAENRVDVEPMTAARLSGLIHGSSDLFRDDGREPWHSVNFLVAHDGLTLFDLYSCNAKNNGQPWPFGPSDGGTDRDLAWDHRGVPERQRQAARTGLALLMLSSGVPMMTGGDEVLRSLRCNNNPYNLDSPANWLSWNWDDEQSRFRRFTQRLLALRSAHPALRPATWTEGVDPDGNGVLDIEWRNESGPTDFAQDSRILAWRLDGDPGLFIAWNRGLDPVQVQLPEPRHTWLRVLDTATWMEPQDNISTPGNYDDVPDQQYEVASRSVIVLSDAPAGP